jgi:hypothetical protein
VYHIHCHSRCLGHDAAEHAHAADRFAHEIVCILTLLAVRSRRLMGNPLGRIINHVPFEMHQ